VKWYAKAAVQGNASAQFNLGHCFQNGVGVTKDAVIAVYWYAKAAAQGNSSAQCNLGDCYERGIGFVQNTALALMWYAKAAAQGFEQAVTAVARLTAASRRAS
jgi:TPR repeat protein